MTLISLPPPSLNATWKVRLITGNSFNTFAINYLALNGNQLQVAYRHYDLNFHFTFFQLLLSVCFIVIIQFVTTICVSVEILIKVHNGSPYYFTRETCKRSIGNISENVCLRKGFTLLLFPSEFSRRLIFYQHQFLLTFCR